MPTQALAPPLLANLWPAAARRQAQLLTTAPLEGGNLLRQQAEGSATQIGEKKPPAPCPGGAAIPTAIAAAGLKRGLQDPLHPLLIMGAAHPLDQGIGAAAHRGQGQLSQQPQQHEAENGQTKSSEQAGQRCTKPRLTHAAGQACYWAQRSEQTDPNVALLDQTTRGPGLEYRGAGLSQAGSAIPLAVWFHGAAVDAMLEGFGFGRSR